MLKLDKRKLKRLQKVWEENPDGVELGTFVKLMMNEIQGSTVDEKLQNMHGFIKHFQSVDINGDGSMEWDELIQ
jgi:Ca2+-binding EF-hand superfamily protein